MSKKSKSTLSNKKMKSKSKSKSNDESISSPFDRYLNSELTTELFSDLRDELVEYSSINISQDDSIKLSELKSVIKNYETFSNKDELIEINNMIDEILVQHINDYINEQSTLETETDDDSQSILSTIDLHRTDEDIIPPDSIKINPYAEEIFDDVIRTEDKSRMKIDYYFSDPRCQIVNNRASKSNSYGIDPYGLIIRKNALNKHNSEFGWKLDNINRPVHIDIQITCTRDENINNVLNIQYQKNPKAFKEKGVINQIYSNIDQYKSRLEPFLNNDVD